MEPTTKTSRTQLIESIQLQLETRIGKERFELWFGHATKWSLHDRGLEIEVQNSFLADCIRSFCLSDLQSVIGEQVGSGAEIRIQSASTNTAPPQIGIPRNGGFSVGASVVRPSAIGSEAKLGGEKGENRVESRPEAGSKSSSSVYREKSSGGAEDNQYADRKSMKVDYWAEFIEGESNRMAYTAAQMVVERPGTISPLLIHGPCGVGKTHLARGIVDQMRTRHRLRRVIYLTAEQFTIDFTDSARGAGFASFRKKYRDIDALVMDDLQFLLGKGATLLELRNTVENLTRNQRQVVFVADRSLPELVSLGNELHARMTGGMVCAMEALDETSRLQLLQRLCHRHAVDIDSKTIEQLVRSACGDARVLFGIAFRLMTAQRSTGGKLSSDQAMTCCADLLKACQPVVRMLDIEKAVCEVFGLEPKSLQAKTKSKTVSQPRMLAMFLARKYTRAAYSEIGQYFGNRQHSTVISAQKKVEDWLSKNESMDHSRGSLGIREMMRNLESALQVG